MTPQRQLAAMFVICVGLLSLPHWLLAIIAVFVVMYWLIEPIVRKCVAHLRRVEPNLPTNVTPINRQKRG